MATSAQKVVFGAMTFGTAGAEQARVHQLSDCATILDVFQKHGHNEIDTARTYGGGSSETYLGQLDLPKRGIVLDTKLAPGRGGGGVAQAHTYTHRPSDLEPALRESLAALQTDKVDMWYLHSPDRSVPYEDTLREVNRLYEQGYFRRFGISNYAAWEVAQMAETARRHGWKAIDVYQGVYNALHRAAEPELFPCLRHYGIAFYEYNPLAGGLLTDRYTRADTAADVEPGSRFDPARTQGTNYRTRYWNDAYFDALDVVRPVAKAHGIPTAEAALRWVSHHSVLRKEHGDAVIIGASSAAQLEDNLASLEKGPLPDEVVQAFDDAWNVVKAACKPYFRV
ncbi:aldo/keto reductase [Sporothrix brasiliensis 5110]|uniref:Aldo/keto reductase n=1 Tax=Sporothrix brasiliensis 5110 TaxID=1398154 RepID=A0A0C2J415_9PEZI|nr:aldo/keto reductase [Sporothrix brasiliensis 5110]KIH93735.1 aldo/keto reductase [Sporothrix brasiliensis 5110]